MEMGQQVKEIREKSTTSHYHQMIHAPNGMQLTGLSETPKMKCNKRILITDGGMKIPTLKPTIKSTTNEKKCIGEPIETVLVSTTIVL